MGERKIHICLVVSGMINSTPYGEEKFTDSFARWLTKHENNVTMIWRNGLLSTRIKHLFRDNKQTDREDIEAKNTLKGHRYLSYGFRLIISLSFFFDILLTNRKYPIDVIHAQDTGYAGLAAVLSSKILKIPVVLSSHGIRHKTLEINLPKILRIIRYNKLEYYLDTFTIKNSNRIIAVNPYIKTYLEKITNRKIDFFPIPIDVDAFNYSESNRKTIRKELRIEENMMVIGYVGRLSSEKNISTLLHSFADIAKKNPELKMVLVGNGPLENELSAIVNEENIEDRVIFCGLRHDIARLLSSVDIFVLPSYTEGWSTALLEAMASGRAIICSDIPANHQLVDHNKEAFFVDPNEQDGFSRAIQQLYDNESLRKKLGKNARIRAKLYDKEIIFPLIFNYYESIAVKRIKKDSI